MQLPRSKTFDAAFALAAIASILYVLGLANVKGDADGLGIPYAFLHRTLLDTMAYGVDALLISLFFPFTVYGETGLRWDVVIIILVAIVGAAALYWFLRRSKIRAVALGIWMLIALYTHIGFVSSYAMQDNMRKAAKCVNKQECSAATLVNRLVFTESETSLGERTGIMLTMNQSFLIMFTSNGLFIAPVESIRFLETAKPALAK